MKANEFRASWTLCKDGLPPTRICKGEFEAWEETEEVLISTNAEEIDLVRGFPDYKSGKMYWVTNEGTEYADEEVIAWMPAPKPISL